MEQTKYTPEEQQYYLHQQAIIQGKLARSREKKIESDITKREARKLRQLNKQEKKIRKENAAKKVAYWKSTTPKYRAYVRGAIARGYTFSLTMEQFASIVQSDTCTFCGGSEDIGVDRIDSTKGYDIHNCQPCCTECNLMKRNMKDEQFLLHITKILNNYMKRSI